MEIPQPTPTDQTHPGTFLKRQPPSVTKTTTETQEENPDVLKPGESRIVQARARYDITEAHEGGTDGILVFESVGLIPYPTDSTLLTAIIITFLLIIMR
tara:strand:- start:211 stop:507 length:297 start_codon:yes stop_codon:yes gene_type:complete